jgi:hypothetical protein
MRKEELHNALMHPENLSDEQLQALSDTVVRFPFFGAAQIALTRAFKARGDVRFTDQLSQAAIYTGHRSSLYQWLKTSKPAADIQPDTPSEEKLPAVELTLASMILDNEVIAPTVSITPAVVGSVTATAYTSKTEETDSSSQHATGQVIESENEIAVSVKLSELDTLEAQILVSAVNTSIEMEVQPEHTENFDEQEPASLDEEPIDENSYAALIYRRAQQKHQLPTEAPTMRKAQEDLPEDAEDLPAFRSTPLSHGVQRIRSTDAKQHQRDLIDRFIHTEPQIARGKAGDYPTGNLAKDSLEDDFSIVTETMAILFAKQGKLDKARKAFRKLIEQHPEKSIYFAAQLKNLDHFKK